MIITFLFSSATGNTQFFAKEIAKEFQKCTEEKINFYYINVFRASREDFKGLTEKQQEHLRDADFICVGSYLHCHQLDISIKKFLKSLVDSNECDYFVNKPCISFMTSHGPRTATLPTEARDFIHALGGFYSGNIHVRAPQNYIVLMPPQKTCWKWGRKTIDKALEIVPELFEKLKNNYDCNDAGDLPEKLIDYDFCPKNMGGPIIVDNDKCIGCRKCISVCPTMAIVFGDNNRPIWDSLSCIGCLTCINHCNSEALDTEATKVRSKYVFKPKVVDEGWTTMYDENGDVLRFDGPVEETPEIAQPVDNEFLKLLAKE
eukprot:TRINITY_DN1858_c0_g1_i1.p1 TRINITY_DN1858_c0_g1~~TRINITY_DN1858_c0_g1_i1.p1  ORF type:complete len:317 (-),score=85.76 TRINITY_DN1858_c0_g1_i1:1643-2593(-)